MTREEEIINKSINEQKSLMESMDWRAGFISGAKWADENPQGMSKMRKDYEFLFMLKKQELIKKACEWLKKELINNRDNFGYPVVSTFDTITLNEFVEEFRKAMEE